MDGSVCKMQQESSKVVKIAIMVPLEVMVFWPMGN